MFNMCGSLEVAQGAGSDRCPFSPLRQMSGTGRYQKRVYTCLEQEQERALLGDVFKTIAQTDSNRRPTLSGARISRV